MQDFSSKTDAQIVKETLKDQEAFVYLMQRYEEKISRVETWENMD